MQKSHRPESKVHWANLGPTWVLSAPGRLHVGPMNLAIRAKIGNRPSGTQALISLYWSCLLGVVPMSAWYVYIYGKKETSIVQIVLQALLITLISSDTFLWSSLTDIFVAINFSIWIFTMSLSALTGIRHVFSRSNFHLTLRHICEPLNVVCISKTAVFIDDCITWNCHKYWIKSNFFVIIRHACCAKTLKVVDARTYWFKYLFNCR